MTYFYKYKAAQQTRGEIRPFVALAAVVTAIVKAILVVRPLPFWQSVYWFGLNILADLSFLGLLVALIFVQAIVESRALRFLIATLLSVLLFWYLVDTGVIFMLNWRPSFAEIFAFGSEFSSLSLIREMWLLFVAYVVMIIFSYRFTVQLARDRVATVALLMLLIGGLAAPKKAPYATSLSAVAENFVGSFWSGFSAEELRRFGAESSLFLPKRPPNAPLIIVVVVESFSAVDSFRTSGVGDLFPRFDEISKSGRLFTNFLANHTTTEGGLVSLFTGQPPIPYPGGSASFASAYKNQDSIVRYLNKEGYHSIFLSSAGVGFRGKGGVLSHLGFNEVLGRDEVERFRTAPFFAFDAPSDGVLFDEALEQIKSAKQKHPKLLFVIETVSSHTPYIDPLGRGDTMENVFDYVDQELSRFYAELRKRGMLTNAQFIVTGDHRKRDRVTAAERIKYGPSAEARIPLLIIDKSIKPGLDDRLFQQADLFRYLPMVHDNSMQLSQFAVHSVPALTPMVGRHPATLKIFSQSLGFFSLSLMGRSYSWEGNSVPAKSEIIELELAQRLARLQFCNDHQPVCSKGKRQRWFFPRMK